MQIWLLLYYDAFFIISGSLVFLRAGQGIPTPQELGLRKGTVAIVPSPWILGELGGLGRRVLKCGRAGTPVFAVICLAQVRAAVRARRDLRQSARTAFRFQRIQKTLHMFTHEELLSVTSVVPRSFGACCYFPPKPSKQMC